MTEHVIGHVVHDRKVWKDVSLRRVIFASSLGTVFEWYDFTSTAPWRCFSASCSSLRETRAPRYLSSLALFGVGFSVRPFGALVFGRIGDLVGRKYTFLVTMPGHGPVDRPGGFAAHLQADRLPRTRGRSSSCAWPRAWPWGANTAGLRPMSRSTRPRRAGGITRARSRQPRRWDSSPAWRSSAAPAGSWGRRPSISGTGSWLAGWRIPFLPFILLQVVSLYIRLKLQESPCSPS